MAEVQPMAGGPHGLELPCTSLLAIPHACPQHSQLPVSLLSPCLCAPSFHSRVLVHGCSHTNVITGMESHSYVLILADILYLASWITHHSMYFPVNLVSGPTHWALVSLRTPLLPLGMVLSSGPRSPAALLSHASL